MREPPRVRFVSDTATLDGDTLKVRGCLTPRERAAARAGGRLRPVGDELEVDARTYADHRKLGMSHGMLGMIPTPSELIVHGRLVR